MKAGVAQRSAAAIEGAGDRHDWPGYRAAGRWPCPGPLQWAVRLGVLALALPLAACDLRLESPTIKEIRERGTLIVLTRNAPTTYYEDRDQRTLGFEHDLAVDFANHLEVKPQFRIYHNTSEILDAIRNGEGDLAAAGLVRQPQLLNEFRFGPVYQEVDQQVVCRRGGRRPNNFLQLAKTGLVIADTGGIEARLNELKGLIPNLSWKMEPDLSSEQILEMVWKGEVDCTVADANIVAINRRYYPELVVKFPIGAAQPLAWVLPRRAMLLQQEVSDWFQKIKGSGRLEALFDRYYGHVARHHEEYDYVDNRRFLLRIRERLPKYKALFQEAGKKHQIPWRLLAAQAYQESHWEPDARSATGVRGIMMLTQLTAKALGVDNRLDPEESIRAGSAYLSSLRSRLPKEIKEPNRTWIALAAYNIGMGHVLDARKLARELSRNPNLWREFRTILPLLSQKRYFKKLKRGYARGSEPVHYVQQIRRYMDILEREDARKAGGRPSIGLFPSQPVPDPLRP